MAGGQRGDWLNESAFRTAADFGSARDGCRASRVGWRVLDGRRGVGCSTHEKLRQSHDPIGLDVIEDRSTLSLWSFVPEGHPAYPAAVHRKVVQQGNDLFIQMSVLREASKPAYEAPVREFNRLNERVNKDLAR